MITTDAWAHRLCCCLDQLRIFGLYTLQTINFSINDPSLCAHPRGHLWLDLQMCDGWWDVMAHIREHPRVSGKPGAALSPRCVSVLNSFFKSWISMEIGYGHTENKPSHVGMKLTFRKHGWFYGLSENYLCARMNQIILASVVSGLRFFVAQNSLSCRLFPGLYSQWCGYVSLRV